METEVLKPGVPYRLIPARGNPRHKYKNTPLMLDMHNIAQVTGAPVTSVLRLADAR